MHKNNFDFQRLIFAGFVLFTHAYALSGKSTMDFFGIWTNDQIPLSYIGVRGFFVLSGYLILQSLDRSKNLIDYYWKRVLRLFPGLAFVLVLTVLLGFFAYQHPTLSYWANKEVWTYFPNNFSLYRLQMEISGVFEGNPHSSTINGSLWTICYEFTMYMLLSGLIIFRKFPKFRTAFLGVSTLAFGIGMVFFTQELLPYAFFINAARLVELGTFFLFGSFLASIKFENFKYKDWLTAGSFVVMGIALYFEVYLRGFQFFTIGFITLGLGLKSTPYINTIGKKIGDLSYGLYIFGFPVQQALVYYFHLDYLSLLLLSIPITMALAWVSWHLIEKRALKFKKTLPHQFLMDKLKQGRKSA